MQINKKVFMISFLIVSQNIIKSQTVFHLHFVHILRCTWNARRNECVEMVFVLRNITYMWIELRWIQHYSNYFRFKYFVTWDSFRNSLFILKMVYLIYARIWWNEQISKSEFSNHLFVSLTWCALWIIVKFSNYPFSLTM